jgi:hypothetical protein
MVVPQQPSQPLTATNVGAPERTGLGRDQLVAEPLMVPLPVVVRPEVVEGAEQPPLSKQDQVSGAGEFHPHALSEPYVNLSVHTAPINQPVASPRGAASERTASADAVRSGPATAQPAGDAP